VELEPELVLEEMWVTEDAQSGRAWEVKSLSFEVEGHSEKKVLYIFYR